MKIYRCKKRFFCTPLKRYIPIDAQIARYENILKLAVIDAPDSENLFSVLVDGMEYYLPDQITWIYTLEPPTLGTNLDYFDVIGTYTEDSFGNIVSVGPAGPQGIQGIQGIQGPPGPASSSVIQLSGSTVGAVQSELLIPPSATRIILPAGSSTMFTIQIAGNNSTDAKAVGYYIRGVIRRDASDNTALVSTLTKETWEEAGQEAADATVEADDTNDALVVKATGIAGKTMSWNAVVVVAQSYTD